MHIHYFDQLESTNNYCKLLDLDKVEEFTVICARSQTAGIGQQGNRWDSQPGMNLTFSLILKPTFLPAESQYQLTMAVAVGIAEWLAPLLPRHSVQIKWPNDIYVDDKKICGTLTTSTLHHGHIACAICGIGININQLQFPSWIPNPTSLRLLTGTAHDTETALAELLASIETSYSTLRSNNSAIEPHYLSRLYRLGIPAKYEYHDSTITATIQGIDRYGHLLLATDDRRHLCCDIKEIKFLAG